MKRTQPSGSNIVLKQPRITPIATRKRSQREVEKMETTHDIEERCQGKTSMAQPSQIARKPAQGKDARKKRKCETKDPNITLTWDDAELVVRKVRDRSEEVVRVE
jgi:hypothetical protein